jgi:hypothetical protein
MPQPSKDGSMHALLNILCDGPGYLSINMTLY